MLRFFRTLRQRLLAENRVNRYLLYAVGEILLVVIGILIALQIDNWNEDRKQQEQFRLGLEQAYNSIDISNEGVRLTLQTGGTMVDVIDGLLTVPEQIPDWKLPYLLFFVDQGLRNLSLETLIGQPPNLPVNPNDFEQIKLAKEVSSYFDRTLWQELPIDSLLTPELYQAGLPIPLDDYGISIYDGFESVDRTFFSKEELELSRSLVSTPKIRQGLRTLRASLMVHINLSLSNTLEEGRAVMNAIRKFHPEVRLLYKDLGILGTALEGYIGVPSVPMRQVDARRGLWEAELTLKDGTVKFRTGDNWRQNWGGKDFPAGQAMYYGRNIPVKAGRYRIRLDLLEKTYEFIDLPE